MVKKKGATWHFFKEKGKNGVVYKHSNVNKMAKHINKCFKCPKEMKKILYLVPTTVSTRVDLSMSMSTPKTKIKCPQQGQQLKELKVDVSFELEEANPAGPRSSRSQTFPVLSLSETERSATATNASNVCKKCLFHLTSIDLNQHLPS
ncbi:unnamed protein product [Psylliodes chrysocephalus]|uniref:Uncharacterized protein n=1 Tax=Psylliodes chrysocephalus TaxID=3402493 RepID=A0A9P0GHS2_9CUCU|nr:unnamed protein product [Psylliodes chrysocephala]